MERDTRLEAKIIDIEDFPRVRERLREEGRTVVMCHGVYDLLHYGHIEHLKEAKGYGDILVVSVTSKPFVNKGPDRPYFDDRQRTEFLASIECVDYVVLSHEPTARTNIGVVKPDVYVKGQEFKSGDDGITGNISGEISLVESLGGVVKYTQGEIYSSSKLLNNFFGALPEGVTDYSHRLIDKYGEDVFDRITEYVEGFKGLRVLLVGDIIIDEYEFCAPQGLTNKDNILATRFQGGERYLGGVLAIARHMANFCDEVTMVSMMGSRDAIFREEIERKMPQNVRLEVFEDAHFVTPVKRRYLKHHEQRGDNEKLFSVEYLNNDDDLNRIDYTTFINYLKANIGEYDEVVVSDYGHGLVNDEAITVIEEGSRFLGMNCQANSGNYGQNVITKYHRADAFALDEREMRLAVHKHGARPEELLDILVNRMDATGGWLTLGARGAIYSTGLEYMECPPLTLRVSDTVGAGDAFFALAMLCAACEVPGDIATLISNAAGAMKTHIIGNKSSIKKKDMLKFIRTILNV